MKVLVLVLFCFCFYFAFGWRGRRLNSWQPEREVLRECLDEYDSVSEDDIRPLLRGELKGSHEAKCVVSCLLQKLDGIRVDKKVKEFNKNELLERVRGYGDDYEISQQVIEVCATDVEVDEDECNSMVSFSSCVWKSFKDV